jgi:hypothetical protein
MAAIVFDVREAERRLLAAGAPPEVAEATADLMSNAVIHNLDSLVTREYLDHVLDARFSQHDAKWEGRIAGLEAGWERRFSGLEAGMEQRISGLEAVMEQRFIGLEAGWDRRFTSLQAGWEQRFHALESMFIELKGQFRVMQVVQAMLLAGVFLPQLRALVS